MRTHSRSGGTGRLAVFAGGLLLASTWAVAGEGPDVAAAGRGHTTYDRYCKVCHGDRAQGDGALAEDLKVPPGDLTRLSDSDDGSYPFDKVVTAISLSRRVRGHGSPDMPAWGKAFEKTDGTGAATPQEAIQDLAHYLWTLQKKAPPKDAQ
jgi:mono/diheme cytochrome c family protein